VLVLQPENDRMTPEVLYTKTFQEIGPEKKKLVPVQGSAHFPADRKAYQIWAEEADQFIRSIC